MRSRFPALFLVFATLLLAGCTTSGRSLYVQRDVAAFIPTDSIDVEAYRMKYEGEEGVFTHRESTAEHAIVKVLGEGLRWEYFIDSRIRYVILDPEAEWLTTFRTNVARGGVVEGVAIRVTSPEGEARVFGMDDLAEEVSSGETVYKMAYPNVESGTVVEENVRVRYEAGPGFVPPIQYDVMLQSSIPIESLKYRFAYPSWWAVQIKKTGLRSYPAYDSEYDPEQKKAYLTYEASDVEAVREEVFAPYFKERAEHLVFQVTELSVGNTLNYTSAASWEEMASSFKQFAFRRGGFLSNPVRRALNPLRLDGLSQAEKLDRIVRHVQDTIELGASSKNDFNTVLKERRGNLYLVTGLAQAMLAESGIEASYVLIHSAKDGYFDESYVSGNQLYLPAVAARVEGETRVVFPWAEGLPVTHIPEYFQGQRAMRINENGFNGFMTVPSHSGHDNATDENFVVDIDADGVVRVEEERVFRGSNAYTLRRSLDDLEPDERDEKIEELLTYTDGEVEDFAYTVENEHEIGEPLVVRLTYAIDDLVTVTPEEVLFQTGGLFSPASSATIKVDTDERQSPIRIYHDEVQRKRIELRYPASWTLTTELDEATVENPFGSLTSRYTVEPGSLVAHHSLALKRAEAPASDFGRLLTLTGSRGRLQIPTLVFGVDPEL